MKTCSICANCSATGSNLAVIDRDVFHWLINHDRQLQVAGLQFHPRILEHKSLHIMFHPDQQALQQRVAQAIARLDIVQLSEDYQRRYLQSPPAPDNQIRRTPNLAGIIIRTRAFSTYSPVIQTFSDASLAAFFPS